MESALFEPIARVEHPAGTLGRIIVWPSRIEEIVVLDPSDTNEVLAGAQ